MGTMEGILNWFRKLFKCLVSTNMGRMGLAYIWIITFLSINTLISNPIFIWISVVGVILLIISLMSGIINGWVVKTKKNSNKMETI